MQMDLSVHIQNEEDIHYLSQFDEERKTFILQTAITIGLKSMQMSEVNMDCHSYIEPIQRIVEKSTESGKESLDSIEDKLDTLLHIKTNSSRKGRLSENICMNILKEKYPSWDIKDVASSGYEGDCRAETEIGEILYEFKTYDTNVNREQIDKFHRDIKHTGVSYGIFVSNTSGIVGKKNIEWELFNDHTLIIYVSNMGLGGYGCILGTELLLALHKINIFEQDKYWLYHQNHELKEIIDKLESCMNDLRRNNEMIKKHHQNVNDQRIKMNMIFDSIERSIFQIELESDSILKKIIGKINSIQTETQELEDFNEIQFLEKIVNPKMKYYYEQIIKLIDREGYTIQIKNSELIIHQDEICIAYTHSTKTKLELRYILHSDEVNIYRKYEKIKGNEIHIEINDTIEIWKHIQMRMNI